MRFRGLNGRARSAHGEAPHLAPDGMEEASERKGRFGARSGHVLAVRRLTCPACNSRGDMRRSLEGLQAIDSVLEYESFGCDWQS
ncbi:hypothetical protein GCM10008171_19240 [Methylopila jiangsuensis]|uniref:Uncharacterized protein n=1 Tax=Methylopila jiangsuensis TaxID=586230 RepID=A0A9W6JIX6_9HYPH|nr:hypothetical protein GCM10008171_19240 [Methylopila jiangsuensis]